MIDKLSWRNVWGNNGVVEGYVATRAPNNAELTEKVNEIIDVLNKLLEPKEQTNEQKTPNVGKDPCQESRSTTGSIWPSAE